MSPSNRKSGDAAGGKPTRRDILAWGALGPVLLAPGLLGLGACQLPVPGQGPPPTLYRLTPKSTFSPDLPTVDWQLLLEVPVADAGLSTTRIALQHSATKLEYYARASWIDSAPLMLQTLMVESFENSRHIVAVGRESVGLRPDFVLKTELREFQAEYFEPGAPKVHVVLNAKLVKMPERVIIGSESFEALSVADLDDMEAIIAAFDDALGKVLKRLVEWTLLTGERGGAS
ncbi:MAG: ABC-type transport auxiliary lipoprotein family protein [Kiloniellales bacterium]